MKTKEIKLKTIDQIVCTILGFVLISILWKSFDDFIKSKNILFLTGLSVYWPVLIFAILIVVITVLLPSLWIISKTANKIISNFRFRIMVYLIIFTLFILSFTYMQQNNIFWNDFKISYSGCLIIILSNVIVYFFIVSHKKVFGFRRKVNLDYKRICITHNIVNNQKNKIHDLNEKLAIESKKIEDLDLILKNLVEENIQLKLNIEEMLNAFLQIY